MTTPQERIETGEPLEVGFDIDDVIFPWFWPAHDVIVAAGHSNGVTPSTYAPYDEYGIPREVWLDTLADACLVGDLYRLPPNPGAAEAMRQLHYCGHRIHLVTARGSFEHGDRIEALTRETLQEFAVPYDSITFRARDKDAAADLLGLDFFIDDHIRNYESVALTGIATYLLTQPWNAEYEDAFRVDTVAEYVDLVLKFAADGEGATSDR